MQIKWYETEISGGEIEGATRQKTRMHISWNTEVPQFAKVPI